LTTDALNSLLDSSQINSGDYKPTNFDTTTDSLPAPAPAGPYGATLSAFNGLNPNGPGRFTSMTMQTPIPGISHKAGN